MKKVLINVFLMLMLCGADAQNYKTGIGVRWGLAPGVTFKQFLGGHSAVEGILSTRWRGFIVTALYEYHSEDIGVEGLTFFAGAGAHLALWTKFYDDIHWWDPTDKPDGLTVFGTDIVLGLDYTLARFPVNLSIDWKPAYNFSGYSGFWWDGAGLSVRYAIK